MKSRLIYLLLIFLLSGCSLLNPTATQAPTQEPTETLVPTITPAQDATSLPQPETVTLKVWVPPQFDPSDGSAAGELLTARLNEFSGRRQNVNIDVRVKAVEGPGGLLDTLSTASAGAPLAVPDLVALPRETMEVAALKNLLIPFDGLTISLEDPNWYTFARELAHLQGSTFGLPFAGDSLMLAYRPSVIGEAPSSWAASLDTESPNPVGFPAADPDALFTLAMYQSVGGSLIDENGRPVLNSVQLTEVLTYFHQAAAVDVMPFWLTQYETDQQSWTAFSEGQTDMVVTWTSRFLSNPPVDTDAAPLPTADGQPFTITDGWVWALASNNPAKQELTAELAEFLTEPVFLGQWTEAAGYLPTRPNALDAWEDVALQSFARQILPSASLLPPQDILTTIGPVLSQATIDVLKDQVDPEVAATNAAQSLAGP